MTAPVPSRPRKLPIGLQNLREIITDGYCYVDKTMHALALAEAGKYYFLSRPRRFGKSLFLDTLKELFEGNEPLFRGLYVHDCWDWSQRHPVIRLDFSAGILENREQLDRHIYELLQFNQRQLGLTCEATSLPGCFAEMIERLHAETGQGVVILVDEYDKPILDNIDHPERAAEVREGLKNLYSAMKGRDAELRFVFMTGVTKFSKVSLFSGINQLQDLTLDPRCATLCGYTQHDLETVFADHLDGVDWQQLRRWYNGYGFLGEPVYNPFDILLFISQGRTYRNYWFETGSPSFLIKLFQQRRYFLPDLESVETSEEILDSFDIERIDPVTLLFQTGYLTIASTRWHRSRILYRLRLPNQEVAMALADHLIEGYAGPLPSGRDRHQDALYDTLIRGDVDALIAAIKRLFAGIPWRNFTYSDLPEYEGYYASVLYAFFVSLNAEVIAEDISHHGQVDLTVKLEGYVYVIEIKVERGRPVPTPDQEPVDNPALAQIQARGYSAKYRGLPARGLFEVGLVFDPDARNLVQGDWAAV